MAAQGTIAEGWLVTSHSGSTNRAATEFIELLRKQLHLGGEIAEGSPAEMSPEFNVYKVAGAEHSSTCCVFVGITNNAALEKRISPTKAAHKILMAVKRSPELAADVLRSCEAIVRVIPCEWAVPLATLIPMFEECASGALEAGAMHQFLTSAGHFPVVGAIPKDNTYSIVYEDHSAVFPVDVDALTSAAERAVTSKKYVRVPHDAKHPEGTKVGAHAAKTFVICIAGDTALLSIASDWVELHRYSLHQVASHSASEGSPAKEKGASAPSGNSTSSVASMDPNRPS